MTIPTFNLEAEDIEKEARSFKYTCALVLKTPLYNALPEEDILVYILTWLGVEFYDDYNEYEMWKTPLKTFWRLFTAKYIDNLPYLTYEFDICADITYITPPVTPTSVTHTSTTPVTPQTPPTTSVTPLPSPATSVTPQPSPTTSVMPQPPHTTSVTPLPSPATSVTPQPSPTTYVTSQPSPTPSVTPQPPPTTYVTPHPSPMISVTLQPSPTPSVIPSQPYTTHVLPPPWPPPRYYPSSLREKREWPPPIPTLYTPDLLSFLQTCEKKGCYIMYIHTYIYICTNTPISIYILIFL